MSRGAGTAARATKKPVIVVAGEHRNDRASLRVLLEVFCPDMRGRIVEITDDVRLRCAIGATLSDRVATLAKKVRARGVRESADVACVFIQEDLDRVDGDAYPAVRDRVQKALDAGLGSAHYVLTVAEMEAWLLLFPDSLAALVSSWTVPAKHRGKDTGRFSDPKHILMSQVSSPKRRYRESDAPDIFAKVVDLGHIKRPSGVNRSWDRFRDDAERCCTTHLQTRKGASPR